MVWTAIYLLKPVQGVVQSKYPRPAGNIRLRRYKTDSELQVKFIRVFWISVGASSDELNMENN